MRKPMIVAAALFAAACAPGAPHVRPAAAPAPAPEARLTPASAASADAERAANERLALAVDSIAAAAVERGDVVGLSVAVLRGGEPVRVHGYGIADLESLAPAAEGTRYYIGSITKPITAAAILRLAEHGRLGLDDDVTRYVPELDGSGPPVTLRHLLTHTSGLAGPQQVSAKFLERRHLEFTRAQLLALLEGEPRVSAPGERFAYNNLGYILLGIVAERVSGQSYEEHLQGGALAPVGASSVALCDARRVIPRRARGYVLQDGVATNHEPVNASLVFAAGGLCAEAADVARWLRALAGGRIVTQAGFDAMSTRARLADGSVLAYGYGLALDSVHGHRRVHHGGDVNGFSGHAAYYPDHDLTVVVLSNTRGPAARQIEAQIARRALGIPETPGVPAAQRGTAREPGRAP
jgi:D-alanyl-D-alanine carboxypeptidase